MLRGPTAKRNRFVPEAIFKRDGLMRFTTDKAESFENMMKFINPDN